MKVVPHVLFQISVVMNEVGSKLDVILEGIRQSEDYLLQKKRKINQVEEKIALQCTVGAKVKKEISQLQEELKATKLQLYTLEEQLDTDLLLHHRFLHHIKLNDSELEDQLQSLESEEMSREEMVEDFVKKAAEFHNQVRLDNPQIPNRKKAIKQEHQHLHLEETRLLCEIKVLEDNKKEEESLEKTKQELQPLIHELQRFVNDWEPDLRNQLMLAHHERDQLMDPNSQPIKRLTSEISSRQEEGEYLNSALLAMQKERFELAMALRLKEMGLPLPRIEVAKTQIHPQQNQHSTITSQKQQCSYKSSGSSVSNAANTSGSASTSRNFSGAGSLDNDWSQLEDLDWSSLDADMPRLADTGVAKASKIGSTQSKDTSNGGSRKTLDAGSQFTDLSELESLDWNSLSANVPKSTDTSVIKVSKSSSTQSEGISIAGSRKTLGISGSHPRPTPSTPLTFTRNPPPSTPQTEVESCPKLPLHLLGHFRCVSRDKEESDETSGDESSAQKNPKVTQVSSAGRTVEASTSAAAKVSSAPYTQSVSATAGSYSSYLSKRSSLTAHAQKPTPSHQESVTAIDKNSNSGSASMMPPPENRSSDKSSGEVKSDVFDQSLDNIYSFAPGWASMSMSDTDGKTESKMQNDNTGKIYYKFKKTTFMSVQDFHEEKSSDSSRQLYQRRSSSYSQGEASHSNLYSSWSSWNHQPRPPHRYSFKQSDQQRSNFQQPTNSQGNFTKTTRAENHYSVSDKNSDGWHQGERKIRFSDHTELLGTPQDSN